MIRKMEMLQIKTFVNPGYGGYGVSPYGRKMFGI
jgi:hypothetical protein